MTLIGGDPEDLNDREEEDAVDFVVLDVAREEAVDHRQEDLRDLPVADHTRCRSEEVDLLRILKTMSFTMNHQCDRLEDVVDREGEADRQCAEDEVDRRGECHDEEGLILVIWTLMNAMSLRREGMAERDGLRHEVRAESVECHGMVRDQEAAVGEGGEDVVDDHQ